MTRDEDRRFYCNDCLYGYSLNPNGSYGRKHHLYDLQWFGYIYIFYNLTDDEKKIYSAHHIKRYSAFPEYRTSLCNGFPIKIKYHDLGSKDPVTGLVNPFHVVNGYQNISDYPEYVKLSYHLYPGFKFLDLNSKMITEIIAPVEDMCENDLLAKYNYYESCGVVYIPLFFDELFPILDWLNAHHFDYRGLIGKGLALPAPEGMYKFE